MSQIHLRATALLDYAAPSIEQLVASRGWRELKLYDRMGAVYSFVRDEIAFGYNETDSLPASRVLTDGYGQCNTKATLLMALLRAVGVPNRLQGATIHKKLQKGIVNGLFYLLAPTSIFHTWVEVFLDGRWVALEGVILDTAYLRAVQSAAAPTTESFLGYGIGTANLRHPPIEWSGKDTFIQSTGVNANFGVYNDPDAFYAEHGDNLSGLRAWLYAHWVRHALNRNVNSIRACHSAERPWTTYSRQLSCGSMTRRGLTLSLCALGLTLITEPLEASSGQTSRHGVTFANSRKLGKHHLVLHGIGVRTVTIFGVAVFVGGLYAPSKQLSAKAILDPRAAKAFRAVCRREVDRDDAAESFRKAILRSAGSGAPKLEKEIRRFIAWLPSFQSGSELRVEYIPKSGLSVRIARNKEARDPLTASTAFAAALFGTWIGPRTIDEDLRHGLLELASMSKDGSR